LKSQENDATDAEAIREALSHPGMSLCQAKSIEQHDLHSLLSQLRKALRRRSKTTTRC
jgi:transposase